MRADPGVQGRGAPQRVDAGEFSPDPPPPCSALLLLTVHQPTLAPSGAVTFKHLEPRALAATLDFPPELLPLFAAASGNDEVDTGALATLHREAMREERARRKATWYAHQPSADDKVKIVAARQAFKDGKVRAKHHLPCRKNAHCNKPMCPYKHPGDSQYLCWHDEDNGLNYWCVGGGGGGGGGGGAGAALPRTRPPSRSPLSPPQPQANLVPLPPRRPGPRHGRALHVQEIQPDRRQGAAAAGP